jgi:hypothetical protein
VLQNFCQDQPCVPLRSIARSSNNPIYREQESPKIGPQADSFIAKADEFTSFADLLPDSVPIIDSAVVLIHRL